MDIKSRLEKTLLGTDNFLLRLNYNKTVYLLYSVLFFFWFRLQSPKYWWICLRKGDYSYYSCIMQINAFENLYEIKI